MCRGPFKYLNLHPSPSQNFFLTMKFRGTELRLLTPVLLRSILIFKLYRSTHHFESGFGVFSNRIGALITLGRAWDYTYPQTCNQVQKRGGSGSGRLSINFARRAHRERRAKRVRSVREPHAAEPRRAKRVRPRRAQRARSRIESDERIESGERSESARCAGPHAAASEASPLRFVRNLHTPKTSRVDT